MTERWLFGGPTAQEGPDTERLNEFYDEFPENFFISDLLPKKMSKDRTEALKKDMTWLLNKQYTDLDITNRTARWDVSKLDRMVPGDVSALRLTFTDGANRVLKNLTDDPIDPSTKRFSNVTAGSQAGLIEQARAIYKSVPFWMDAQFAYGVMASNPPSEEDIKTLRLPFDSVTIWFNKPMLIENPVLPPEEDDVDLEEFFLTTDDDEWKEGIVSALTFLRNRVSWAVGVTLFSGKNGSGICSVALFHLFTGEEGDKVTGAASFPCWLTHATVAPLVYNLAAAIGWGEWKNPDDPPECLSEAATPKQQRKAWKKSVVRKAQSRGVFAGVHVIDMKRQGSYVKQEAAGTHASPVPHLRRGHVRRTRCGPRNDWWYERRWVPPTVVNASNQREVDQVALYRLPLVEEVGDRDEGGSIRLPDREAGLQV